MNKDNEKDNQLDPKLVKVPYIDPTIFQTDSEKALKYIYNHSTLLKTIPGANSISRLFSLKEAESTTRLEGTQVTSEDMALYDEKKEKRSPAREALGVLKAMEVGQEEMSKDKELLLNKTIKKMHKELMSNAMNDQGVPGEFRTMNVRVGSFHPPKPEHVSKCMDMLEEYINTESNEPVLVKIGIVHALFEIIHPFGDGNGRIGRLLIPLLLKKYEVTEKSSFFISSFYEKNRSEYIEKLKNITEKNDWDGWLEFFLFSLIEQGVSTNKKLESLSNLYRDPEFIKLKSKSSQHIKNFIFQSPIFTVPQIITYYDSENEALENKKDLHRILSESPNIQISREGKGKRATLYKCKELVDIITN